ncbi:MAG TPA: ABC transporter permease, partial [Methylomirabilota bacterium]|nr:ABC transporter permease [Methylomirabilota bacterium]
MKRFARRFARSRTGILGVIVLSAVVSLAASAPLLFPDSPFRAVDRPFTPPLGPHLLGTDVLGRDVAAGLAHGARTSLTIGVLATSIAVLLGTIIGGLAGYYGGWIDDLLMRTTEFFQTIPTFLFAIILVAILAPSVKSIVLAIAIVSWPTVARLVRGEFLALRRREFVQSCIGLGMRDRRVILRHILPNCLSPIIVTGSLSVATAILIESA